MKLLLAYQKLTQRLQRVDRLLLMLLLLFCVGSGAWLAVQHVNHDVGQQTKSRATVLQPGNNPADKYDDAQTKSVVLVRLGNREIRQTLKLKWWKRGRVNVWISHGKVSPDNPARSWIYFRLIFLYGVIGFFAYFLLIAVASSPVRLLNAIEKKRHNERESKKQVPENVRELAALCHQHADMGVTIDQAESYGPCLTGITAFRDEYFPERETVVLGELVDFLSNPAYWYHAARIIVGRLVEAGVIRQDYQIDGRIKRLVRT
jgi:TRAP-type C4-dicarboxylate transport system permease small subunit